MRQPTSRAHRSHGFTLVELLVVVIIALILIGILIPTVSNVMNSAKEAKTKAFIAQLQASIETYYQDFHAYPGPFPNLVIYNSGATAANIAPAPNFPLGFGTASAAAGYDVTTPVDPTKITMSENLTLGLLGGLKVDLTNAAAPKLVYDPTQLGSGPMELGTGPMKRHNAYISVALNSNTSLRDTPTGLTGKYQDEAGAADDSIIPEFVDQFSNPMPILYLRARIGATKDTTGVESATNNTVITYDTAAPGNRVGQYDLHQIIAYTGAFSANGNLDTAMPPAETSHSIGVGRSLPEVCYDGSGTMVPWKKKTSYHGLRTVTVGNGNASVLSANSAGQGSQKYYFPYDAYAYFRNNALSSNGADNAYGTIDDQEVPRGKDTYILISAGKDRIYGTDDDITSFGSVTP